MRKPRSKSLPTVEAGLSAEIAHLRSLSLRELRARWKGAIGRTPPAHLPRHLLFAMVAYRIQADVHGDLSAETVKLLDRIGGDGGGGSVDRVLSAYADRQRRLRAGTVLRREWEGRLHNVYVPESGFIWENRTFDSLSAVAFAITGIRWNGPRFFGLRDRSRAGKG
jgi:hypothetical protein